MSRGLRAGLRGSSGLIEQRPDSRDDTLRLDRDEDPEFTQQTAERVQPRGAGGEPARSKAMQGGDGLLVLAKLTSGFLLDCVNNRLKVPEGVDWVNL